MMAHYYRDLFLKYGWFIVLSMLLAAAVAAAVSAVAPFSYDARSTVQVDFPSPDANLLALGSSYVDTEARLATSPEILTALAGRHRGRTANQLGHEVEAARIVNTQIIEITVRDADPNEATSLANDVASLLVSFQQVTMMNSNNRAQTTIKKLIVTAQTDVSAASVALAQLQAAKATPSQVAVAQAQLNNAKTHLTALEDSLSQVQAFQAQHQLSLLVQQPAVSSTPARASLIINVAAALAFGLLLGIVAVVLRTRVTRAPLDSQYLSQLTGLPVLADLARPSSPRVNHETHEGVLDVWEGLARAIAFSSVDRALRTVAFIGAPSPDADHLTGQVAADFALFAAQQHRNTLLVDANLAHPSQHERFSIPEQEGLSTAILASQSGRLPANAIERYMSPPGNVNEPWLRVFPAGPKPPSAGQLLSSEATRQLFSVVFASPANVIVVSAPLASAFSGADAIAKLADGVVLVVDRSRVHPLTLLRATQLLSLAEAPILGVVYGLNDSPPTTGTVERGKKGMFPSDEARKGALTTNKE
jgi:capsular polysaccharide biosynthesis protein